MPASGLEVAIVNPETCALQPASTIGEIWIAGDSVAAGYWRVPEESEKTFRARLNSTDNRAYLRTGDLGFLQDQELFVSGRLIDLIIIRGRNIYPQDIERTSEASSPTTLNHACAAFGVETTGGERPGVNHGITPTPPASSAQP